MILLAMVGLQETIPVLVCFAVVAFIWSILSLISERNSRMQDRLARHSRPASLAEIEDTRLTKKSNHFQGLTDMAKAISEPMMPKSDLEQSELKVRLANAGFRSESATAVYSGIRLA